jgi:uncharacterized iron-regulated protein
MTSTRGRTRWLCVAGIVSVALASVTTSCRAPTPAPAPEREPEPVAPKDSSPPEVVGSLGASRAVEQAGSPFQGLRLSDGALLSDQELMDDLGGADLVCLGGVPGLPRDHWASLQLTLSLGRRTDHAGRMTGLGLQTVPTTAQKTLDGFLAGVADEKILLREAHWQPAPFPDYGLYRPLLNLARDLGLPTVGLGADREILALVRDGGLEKVDRPQRRLLPDLDLSSAEHRRRFERAASADARGDAAEFRYVAAVLDEEVIAETAARFALSRQPANQLLVVAQTELCRKWAVPRRIARRAESLRVVGIRRVDEADASSPGGELEGFDYALVSLPEESPPYSPEPAASAEPNPGTVATTSRERPKGPTPRGPHRRKRVTPLR